MDYTNFAILTMACIGGFMATSYSSIAQQKGWPIGSLFHSDASFVLIAGFICQFGSVVISLFVNPWWSAIIVFILGFIGYTALTSIFKSTSQIVSIILIIASYILVPLYVFSGPNVSNHLEHFNASIEYANRSTDLSNRGDAFEAINEEELDRIIDYKRKALTEAKQVDIEILNDRLAGIGNHFKKEYIQGLELIIEGYDIGDQEKFMHGQILFDKWGRWYSQNLNKIKHGR